MLNITLSSNTKNIRNGSSAADMEIKMMAERRRKEKKKENKDRKKKDKDKLDHRERVKESRDSDNESSEFAITPTKKAGKRKFSSRESDDSSSSDNEWKKCGLKGNRIRKFCLPKVYSPDTSTLFSKQLKNMCKSLF